MIIKHNKIKNSGLLYELLVRQITTDVLNDKKSKALDILRKYYNNSEISKEFKIYNSINTMKNISESKANIVMTSALEEYRKLNKEQLKKDKYNLISEIKQNYDIDDFFKTKVENYKLLASIYILFENDMNSNGNINKITDIKMSILEHMIKPNSSVQDIVLQEFSNYDKGTRHLVCNIMIDKFNKNYSKLLKEQKNLLKEYISNISNNETVREYVNSEFKKVRNNLLEFTNKCEDDVRKTKLEEILSFIKEVPSNKVVSEKDMNNLMFSYELVNEFKNI